MKKAEAAALDTGQIEQGIQKNIFPEPTYNTCQKITTQMLDEDRLGLRESKFLVVSILPMKTAILKVLKQLFSGHI